MKKIPILWRIERFLKKKDQEKSEIANQGYANPYNKRAWALCSSCGNRKFIKRKGSMKCVKCGYKIRNIN